MEVTAITKFKHGLLLKYIKQLGWTQNKLAEESGLTPSKIGDLINLKQRPKQKDMDKLQLAFGKAGIFLDLEEAFPSYYKGLKGLQSIEETRDLNQQQLESQLDQLEDKLNMDDIIDLVDNLPNTYSVLETETSPAVLKRNREIVRRRLQGETFSEIVSKMDCCTVNARRIIDHFFKTVYRLTVFNDKCSNLTPEQFRKLELLKAIAQKQFNIKCRPTSITAYDKCNRLKKG